MTEAAAAALRPEIENIQTWAESMSQVLGQIIGSPTACVVLTAAPAELTAAGESDLRIVGTCSGGLRGEFSLRVSALAALRLAQILMSEPAAPEAELTSDHREAAVELLRQVAGLVASALKPRWGDVQLRLDPAAGAPSWPASFIAWLRAGDDSTSSSLVEIQLSAALAAGLRTEKTEAPPTAGVAAPSSPAPQDGRVKLDLLMEVELAITLRFGSRRLLLREVLDLNPGSVVDLDRHVQDPVDVLLDGRLVARGEVVVMNGNYGLRVTEVGPGINT